MKKVAVFGNAGAGKSTLSRQLAEARGLPLYPLDRMQYREGGVAVPHEEYLRAHGELLGRDRWVIDGFGCVPSAWERFTEADTLVYIDLPVWRHYFWVSKRLLKGLFVHPEGWPPGSSVLRGSCKSYRVVWACHRRLTPAYRQLVQEQTAGKKVFHLRSVAAIREFVTSLN